MFHWIAPLLMGIYIGVLIGPALRVWAAAKDWERQATKDYDLSETSQPGRSNENEIRIPDLDWFDDPLGDRS